MIRDRAVQLPQLARRRLADAIGFLCVAVATFWVYAPTLSFPLWGDDTWHVYELRDPRRVIRVFYDPGVALEVNWVWFRPLGNFTYAVDYLLWGLDPLGYHLHSLLLHCAVAAMLAWLVREWLEGRAHPLPARPAIVWLSALAFTINPIAALTLTRPNMRFDLYAALFSLVALLGMRRWQRGIWPRGRLLALGAAFAAFASKESAVALLTLAFLLSEGSGWQRCRTAFPFVVAWLGYLGWRVLVAQTWLGGYFWLEWSWRDLVHPASYAGTAVTMARLAWGRPEVLAGLLPGLLTVPRLGVLAGLAFMSTLATLIPAASVVALGLHYFYFSLAIFVLALATGLAGMERWWGAARVVSVLCLLAITWAGHRGIPPLLGAEVRLAEEERAAATSLARQPPPSAGLTDYFVIDSFFPDIYLPRAAGLLTGTLQESWHVLARSAALASPGLVGKAAEGAARIFTYDGVGWRNTTSDTARAIQEGLAGPKPPAPTLDVTADRYRVTVRLAADTHRGPFRLYFNRTGETGVYAGFVDLPDPRATFSAPGGTYALTATALTPDGESAQAREVRLTVPVRVPGDASGGFRRRAEGGRDDER